MVIFDLLPVVLAFTAGIIVHAIAAAIGEARHRNASLQDMRLTMLRPANDCSFFDGARYD